MEQISMARYARLSRPFPESRAGVEYTESRSENFCIAHHNVGVVRPIERR